MRVSACVRVCVALNNRPVNLMKTLRLYLKFYFIIWMESRGHGRTFIMVRMKLVISKQIYWKSVLCIFSVFMHTYIFMYNSHLRLRWGRGGVALYEMRDLCLGCLTWTPLLFNTSCTVGKITLLFVHVCSTSNFSVWQFLTPSSDPCAVLSEV